MRFRALIAIFILFIFALVARPHSVGSASVDDLRKKIQDREAEIRQIEQEIAAYQKSLENQSHLSKTLSGEIKKLETQIKGINADIRLTESRIQKTELRISELDSTIADEEKTIEHQKEILTELIKSLDESDKQSIVEIMFSYANIADFFSEQEASLSINKDIEQQLRELKKDKDELEIERSSKQKEEQDYIAYKKDLAGRKDAKQSLNGSKAELLKQSKNQESRYQQLVADREAKRAAIQKEMQSIEDDLKKLIDVNSLPGKHAGVLSWPVEIPVITQGFGMTSFAQTYGSDVYKGNGHNGIDLKAAIGTRLLAAADGVVKDTGNADAICPGGSYGKWVVIEHQNGLTTLYGHLSSIGITKGQSVKRGSIIGYSGDTGFVTGPHLHFTVYASNTYRLSQTRHCGSVPAGGYLNPLDYL